MHNFEWQWKVNCWCVFWLFLHLFYHPSVEKERKKQFFGAKIGVNDSLKKYLTQHLRFPLFFLGTDTVLLSSLAWFKVTLVEVGNLRNKKKKGKGRGSLTTFFFERLMSMIESFKLMSSASESRGFLKDRTPCRRQQDQVGLASFFCTQQCHWRHESNSCWKRYSSDRKRVLSFFLPKKTWIQCMIWLTWQGCIFSNQGAIHPLKIHFLLMLLFIVFQVKDRKGVKNK